MRFFVNFIDMLRPDLCRTFNPSTAAGPIDGYFERLGGTFFRRAYTPAPITSRSMASFWSGLYPAKTGCLRTKHWPRDFMPRNLPNILSAFADAGYSIHCFLNRNEKVYGLLPPEWQERAQLNEGYDLGEFLKSIPKRDKQLIFVSLIDVHWFMTDHGYTVRNFLASQEIPVRALEAANRIHPLEEFDAVVTFSDHGFQEGQWHDCPWQERHAAAKTGIVLGWRGKGPRRTKVDDRLRSIMDVFPTLLATAGIACPPVDGRNLFDGDGHEYIVHEDAFDLAAHGPPSEVDLWGMTLPDGYVSMTSTGVHVAADSEKQLLGKMGGVPYIERIREMIGRHSPTMGALDRELRVVDDWNLRKEQFRASGGYPDPIFADGTPVERWADFLEDRRTPAPAAVAVPVPVSAPDAGALFASAYEAHQAGRTDEAARLYRQTLALDPSSADSHHLKAIATFGKTPAERSIEEFARATAIAPANATFLTSAARAMLGVNAYERAVPMLRRSLALEPGNIEARGPLASMASILYARRQGRADPSFLGSVYDDMGPRLPPNPYAIRLRQWVAPLLGPVVAGRPRRLVDIGCGTGPVGDAFHELFDEIVGCDMSVGSLRIAASKGRYSRLDRADILAFLRNEPEASYDLLTAAGSFCYFGDLSELLALARRVVRPEGLIAFTIFRSDKEEPERDLGKEMYGIFKHSAAYVEKTAMLSRLSVVAVGRDQKIFDGGGRDIVDDVYVLRKPA